MPFLKEKVDLYPDLAWVWEGFNTLAEKRVETEAGPQPIPMCEIAAYADYVGIVRRSERQDFLYYVTALDRVSIAHSYEKIKEQRKKQAAKNKSAKHVT